MGGCRDCSTCTQAGGSRAMMNLLAGCLHFSTAGISWIVKRTVVKHCPQCPHLLSSSGMPGPAFPPHGLHS